jgi:hypothetical protein
MRNPPKSLTFLSVRPSVVSIEVLLPKSHYRSVCDRRQEIELCILFVAHGKLSSLSNWLVPLLALCNCWCRFVMAHNFTNCSRDKP